MIYISSFVPAIFVLVLLQFYCTYETDNYLWWFYTKNSKNFQKVFLHVLRYLKVWGKWWAILFFQKMCRMRIFGFQIYLLFFKNHRNGLRNKFISTLSLIKPPKNVCNLRTLVLGCSRKRGHWHTHLRLKYSQTKIQIFEQNLSCMLAKKSIAGLVVLLICTNYSKTFCKQISAMHFFVFKH